MNKNSRIKIHDKSDEFFTSKHSFEVLMSPVAAKEACNKAAHHNKVVIRIEGGISRLNSVESRLDCIWNGILPPLSLQEAIKNNQDATRFVNDMSANHDVFSVFVRDIDDV